MGGNASNAAATTSNANQSGTPKKSKDHDDQSSFDILAMYQSLVYGNDQLQKRNSGSIVATTDTGIPIVKPVTSTPANGTIPNGHDAPMDIDVALYQSAVYANEQPLKRRNSRTIESSSDPSLPMDPTPLSDRLLSALSEDGVDQNYSMRLMKLFGDDEYDTDAMEQDCEDQTDSNILPSIDSQKCRASLMRFLFNIPSQTLSVSLWFDYMLGPHYIGCLGQQSYLFSSTNDIIVGHNRGGLEVDFLKWYMKMNNVSESQFYWINGQSDTLAPRYVTSLLDDESQTAIKDIAQWISRRIKEDPSITTIQLKPFRQSKEYNELMQRIESLIEFDHESQRKVEVKQYICSAEWAETFANKACLHRFITSPERKSLFEEKGVFYGTKMLDGFTECRGYVCCNKDEILMAYDKLTHDIGHNKVVLKDCYGAGGDDITFWNSKQEIADHFEWKKEFKWIEMEENLMVTTDATMEGLQWVGCQWYDNKVMPYCWEQIIIDDSVFDGAKLYLNQEISLKIKRITKHIMDCIGTKFMGSFDFAVQRFADREPRIFVVDINTARYTAPMQSFIAMKKFGITDKFAIRKNLALRKDATFKEVQSDGDMLFREDTGVGVYFHSFHPPAECAVMTIFGDDEEDANRRMEELESKYGGGAH